MTLDFFPLGMREESFKVARKKGLVTFESPSFFFHQSAMRDFDLETHIERRESRRPLLLCVYLYKSLASLSWTWKIAAINYYHYLNCWFRGFSTSFSKSRDAITTHIFGRKKQPFSAQTSAIPSLGQEAN